ncbi:RimK family alpha-L-glutamate ligase [Zobellella endophytica]|uniref:RimK family alpha-L-glutamate ligase n=1 Tax=Zobellella endophytica TaxID=2116700 RepID=A0A2P7RB42_9GAMM|nr:RimK family protein [Zobellella endophytica]PSJ47458.1 RimK family alpha-L-glutamate ligase [Zobellella endophytica]
MTQLILVVDELSAWAPYFPSENLVDFQTYLKQAPARNAPRTRVINLCKSGKYLSNGYYCSLLAEARGQHVIPSVSTLNNLRNKGLFAFGFDGVAEALDQWLADGEPVKQLKLKSYFGHCVVPGLGSLCRELFERLPCPIMELTFKRRAHWELTGLATLAPRDLAGEEEDQFADALEAYSRIIWRKPKSVKRYRYDLAMLINPDEELPPSDPAAIKRFIRAGERAGVNVETITRKDYQRLAEYDALFIRETTAIDHHTFRFAQKAEHEGLVVIDSPTSILRCANKIFLAESFAKHGVPAPKTLMVNPKQKDAADWLARELGYPLVLKIPDGAFSRGVYKVADKAALVETLAKLRNASALVLAQEYFFTEFDWRIGVLNHQPIFACKYFMVKGHWQIYRHNGGGQEADSGGFVTLPTFEAPKAVINAALKAVKPIGDGLYGVDIKEGKGRVAVIEVNDNPNIDHGVEDVFLKDKLYDMVIEDFVRRLEAD